MKKMLISVLMCLGLLFTVSAFAWQNPCILQGYDSIKSGDYILTEFTPTPQFGPAPDCGGNVTIIYPDTKKQCVLSYAVWGYDIYIGKDKTHSMNFRLVSDTLIPQNNTKWEDVLAENGCPKLQPEELCGPNNLNLCPSQTACEVATGHWYNDTCNVNAQESEGSSCPDCNCTTECPACNCTAKCPACNCTTPEDKPFTCPLVGNVYRYESKDMSIELSDFECEVGPGCEGACSLWYGNFDSGPLYHDSLPFSCTRNGITILGLPCDIDSKGNLECLIALIDNYHCYKVGAKTYCFPKEKKVLQFNKKE